MNKALNADCAEKRTYMDMELLVARNLVRTPQTRDLRKLLGIYALQGIIFVRDMCVRIFVFLR